jgi:ribosome-associated protein
MIEVEITKEPVELYKILKFENLVDSGGEAKMVIANGLVSVNGQIETRKRKKIVSGDTIEFAGETFSIKLNSIADLSTTIVDDVTKPTSKIKNKPALNLSTLSKKKLPKEKSVKKSLAKKSPSKKLLSKKNAIKK